MPFTSWMRRWLTHEKQPFIFTDRLLPRPDIQKEDGLGLYVHIPFCRSLCGFCPYCKEIFDEDRAALYLQALLREIDLTCAGWTEKQPVTSLYFGGGTPALMAESLEKIVERLQRYFDIQGGIGVELHPDDVTASLLKTLKNSGFTMVSIGIQSFDEGCLAALGRAPEDCGPLFEAVRSAGFETVDMDLIFAIPGQTEDSLKRDVETAFAGGATQISTYPFIDFSFARNRRKPLPEKDKRRMLAGLSRFCRENGYERTSVWTFARPGTQKYSSITRDSFLGFGVSASSLLRDRFVINTFSIDGYARRIEQGLAPQALSLSFTQRQRMVYYLFWNAYTLEIDEEKFSRFFGVSLSRLYGKELAAARLLGLVKKEGSVWRLTERGAYAYHYVEQAYTSAYIDKTWGLLRREAFPERLTLL